ncbi:hypothetical protein OBBRIDRAFT_799100 [Obba rivulosa]|uniref:Uncharacterized protein n=1 Tax=Obba rivulosa TaxID=1052685 RepID=A0A8E2DE38_9APHY|nr:hypothetical protein OBBRIDRAFT_799100 [Obba rivulosa]
MEWNKYVCVKLSRHLTPVEIDMTNEVSRGRQIAGMDHMIHTLEGESEYRKHVKHRLAPAFNIPKRSLSQRSNCRAAALTVCTSESRYVSVWCSRCAEPVSLVIMSVNFMYATSTIWRVILIVTPP